MDGTNGNNACGMYVLKYVKAFKTRVGYRRQVVNIIKKAARRGLKPS